MNTYHFVHGVKVQGFCLTLLGEARLLYHSLEPINVDGQGLQILFRQQYSKIVTTREQLFHAWRSFNFDENTETIDAYVSCISQVAARLGYGEPQILEVFKNTLYTKLYWILFPIDDLRQAVETAKRTLTKEKLDRQLTRHSSSTPFMSIRDGHNRKVSFDTKEESGDKIDKLVVMIGKLAMRDSRTGSKFKPQIHQNRGRGQNRNYISEELSNRYRSNNRSSSGDRGLYRQDRSRPRYEQNYRTGNFRGNIRSYGRKNSRGEYSNNYRNDSYDRQNSRENYRNSFRNDSYDRSRNRSRERSFSRNYGNNTRNRSTSNSRSRSGSRSSKVGIEFDVISVGNTIISQGTVLLLGKKKR